MPSIFCRWERLKFGPTISSMKTAICRGVVLTEKLDSKRECPDCSVGELLIMSVSVLSSAISAAIVKLSFEYGDQLRGIP